MRVKEQAEELVKHSLKILDEKLSLLNENWISELELQNKELSDMIIDLQNQTETNTINTNNKTENPSSKRRSSIHNNTVKARQSLLRSNQKRKTSILDETVIRSSKIKSILLLYIIYCLFLISD